MARKVRPLPAAVLQVLTAPEDSDRQLLERFMQFSDEQAFAALVRRHAALVQGVCRRSLRDHHDAEDVFQATFLVLARKAGSIRNHDAVGSWLYGVAYRLARDVREARARRLHREQPAGAAIATASGGTSEGQAMTVDADAEVGRRELRLVLDGELARLPEKYRSPLILCYLEGKTYEQAARQLCWALGTFKSRLARAGDLLRERLALRGVAVSGPALAALCAGEAAEAAVPPDVVHQTVQTALAYAAEPTAATLPAQVVALAEGFVSSSTASPFKIVGVVLLTAGLVGAGVGALLRSSPPESPPVARAEPQPEQPPQRLDVHGDPLPLEVLARFGTVRWRPGVNVTRTLSAREVVTSNRITRVAFGPDGNTLISANDGGAVCVWDRQSGRAIRVLQAAGAVTVSPDGRLLADLDRGGVIHLRDLATGKERLQLKNPPASRDGVLAFAANSKTLAYGTADRSLVLCDTETGREVRRIAANAEGREQAPDSPGIVDFATSPAHDVLAVTEAWLDGNENRFACVHLLDAATGKNIRTIKLEGDLGNGGLTFSPDGNLLAYCGVHEVHVHEVATGKQVRKLPGPWLTHNVVFSPDGKAAALAGALEARVIVRDVQTGAVLREFRRDKSRAPFVSRLPAARGRSLTTDVAFSPDGKFVVTGGVDNAVRVWNVATGQEEVPVAAAAGRVTAVTVAPDGNSITALADDNVVRRWDARTGAESHRYTLPAGTTCVVFTPDGTHVALGSTAKGLTLVEIATGKEVCQLTNRAGNYAVLAFSGDGQRLAFREASERFVRVLETTTGKEVTRLTDPALEVPDEAQVHRHPLGIAFSPDGRLVASLVGKGNVQVWEIRSGARRATLVLGEGEANGGANELRCLVFAPDGRTLAVENADRTVTLFEVASARERARLGKALPPPTADDDPRVRGTVSANFDVTRQAPPTLAFTPDSRVLATRGPDRAVHLWDALTATAIGRLDGHAGDVVSLAFGPGGKTLVSGSCDTTALLWSVPSNNTALPHAAPQAAALWDDLAAEDAGRAYRAVAALASAPQAALPLLARNLQPAAVPEAATLARLVAALDDPNFAAREQAQKELERLADLAAPALRKALEGNPPLETRQRVEAILGSPLPTERLRQLRAVEVLERIASLEARRILQSLAQGDAGFRLTDDAQAALKRLAP